MPPRARSHLGLALAAGLLAGGVVLPGAAVGSPVPGGVTGSPAAGPATTPPATLPVHREAARSLGRVDLRRAATVPERPRATRAREGQPRLTWDRPTAGVGAGTPTAAAMGTAEADLTAGSGTQADAASPAGTAPPAATSDFLPSPALGVGQANGFAGMTDLVNDVLLDCGGSRPCVEPPDPWIAAGPNHLVQMVNMHTRITDRAGSQLLLVANATFFGVPASEYRDADGRILYVPERDRWIASILSFGCAGGHLYLAVSTSGDPTAEWTRFVVDFPGAIPDYPGLGYGSTTVALSANEYEITGCDGVVPRFGAYLGTSLHVVDWADLLDGGGPPTFTATTPDTAMYNWRPAPNLVADPTIHALVEIGTPAAPGLGHATISGTVAGGDLAVSVPTDLTGAPGLPALSPPPAPQDRGGLIPDAVDERVTDALRLGSRLAYVHTAACGSGSTLRDCVRVTELDVAGPVPTVAQSLLVDAPGTDTFTGGVGFSDDGTLYVVYSRSSPTSYVSSYARWQRPADPRGAFGPGTVRLAAGRGAYGGLTGNTRWGDYVGVARDPAAPAAAWQANQYADTGGGWATRVSQLVEDSTPPVVSAPQAGFASGATIGRTSVPVVVSWTATDPGSGVASARLQVARDGGGWTAVTLASATATSATVNLAPGGTSYAFRVTATDGAGNVTPWTTGSPFHVTLVQESSSRIAYAGSWGTSTNASYSGGRTRFSGTAGRRATISFNGYAAAWIAPYGPTRGSARLVVDGVAYTRTYSTYRSSPSYRRIVTSRSWATSGPHSLRLEVVGTAGHPRVDVDAFVVLE